MDGPSPLPLGSSLGSTAEGRGCLGPLGYEGPLPIPQAGPGMIGGALTHLLQAVNRELPALRPTRSPQPQLELA